MSTQEQNGVNKFLDRYHEAYRKKWRKNHNKIVKCYLKNNTHFRYRAMNGYISYETYRDKAHKHRLCSIKFVPGFVVNYGKKYIDFAWKIPKNHPFYKTVRPYIPKINAIGRKYKIVGITRKDAKGIDYKTKKQLMNALANFWLCVLMTATGGLTIDFIALNKSEKLWGVVKSVKK